MVMFVLTMDAGFKVGDTREVRVNGDPTSVTWSGENTIVLGADDARQILMTNRSGSQVTFICSDPGCPETAWDANG
jgi:hypothetical protein